MLEKLAILSLATALAAGCGGEPAKPAPAPPASAPKTAADRPQEMVQEDARPGMGAKGRGYGTGPIATPLEALARTEQQVPLLLIEQAIQLYKAEDPRGRGPKTHEEFMEKIIRANQIKLPALPPGHQYLYDPKQEKLTVLRPKAEKTE